MMIPFASALIAVNKTDGVISIAPAIISADSYFEACAKALVIALDKWPVSEGWSEHAENTAQIDMAITEGNTILFKELI